MRTQVFQHDPTSTLTDRYQTTVPEPIRRVLRLKKRDKISYVIQPDGKVYISRDEQEEDDPVLNEFLTFLENDIRENPQHLRAVNSELLKRISSLTKGVDVDLDAPLSDGDE